MGLGIYPQKQTKDYFLADIFFGGGKIREGFYYAYCLFLQDLEKAHVTDYLTGA